jgi:hypothetical protein
MIPSRRLESRPRPGAALAHLRRGGADKVVVPINPNSNADATVQEGR